MTMKKASRRAGLAIVALTAGLSACMPRNDAPTAAAASVVDAHNSRNSLDWAGTYQGVLPCADCPGIKTRLVLHSDGRFDLQTQYLDRQPKPESVSGRFSWNSAGSAITLDAAGSGQQFQLGEGRLLQLNRDGSAPPWNSPTRLLNKVSKP